MNFALLGDHLHGLDMARALAASGRHRLLVYCGPSAGEQYLHRWELRCERVGDVEEVLANPAVEAVIVAAKPGRRFEVARRALQAERHVLCVHPLDAGPDAAHEAALLQREKRVVLLPLLPELMHPALEHLAKLVALDRGRKRRVGTAPRLIVMERQSPEAVLYDADQEGHPPGFPGWEVLRWLAGEIAEVSAFARGEEVLPDEPVLLCGRFERGGMFHVTLLPDRPEARWRLQVLFGDDSAELLFPEGWPGPSTFRWRDDQGELREQRWDDWNPWPRLVEIFEDAVAHATEPTAAPAEEREHTPTVVLSFRDEVRCLELDDAARRSIARRRSSLLEYQEAVEEASFKGTMTLVGCGLLWASLALLVLSIFVPQLGWLILPLIVVFLSLQVLRWFVSPPTKTAPLPRATASAAPPPDEHIQAGKP